jgi:thiamine biosynthesis protein ThiS
MLRVEVERFLASILGNGMVVPAGRWPETRLSPGDELEIVRPFSGG